MKKTLVALAALAATSAFAQSSVTITGLIDMGYQSLNSPANAAGLQTGDLKRIAHNGTGTTAIVLGVTEEINSDLSASIRYEMNPDFVNGTGLTGGAGVGAGANSTSTPTAGTINNTAFGTGANGYNFIGVSSKSMGGVKLGRLNTGTLAAWNTAQVFGTALGGGFGSAGVFTRYGSSSANYNQTAPTRFNNSVEYQSPAIMGVTLRALMAPKVNVTGVGGENACLEAACTTAGGNSAAVGANRAGVTDISLGYSQGPLNAMYSTQKISTGAGDTNALVNPALQSTASTDVTTNVMAANYTLGATRLYVGSFTLKAGTTIDDKGTIFGVKHTMGQIDLMANMTTLKSSLTGTTLNQADRKVVGLGADYNLSKRTAVYFRNEARNADTDGTVSTTATLGSKTTTTAVGFRHTF
jgi:predicted porin